MAVFGERRAGHAVEAAAFIATENVERRSVRCQAGCQRHDVGADPVRDRRRHRAAQGRRRVDRHPLLVRQHDRFQPHQVLAAAGSGPMDVGNRGRDRDLFRQRLPAGRGGGAGRGRGRLFAFGGRNVGHRRFFWFRRLDLHFCLRRTRPRQRHWRMVRRHPRLMHRSPHADPAAAEQLAKAVLTGKALARFPRGLGRRGQRAKYRQRGQHGNHRRARARQLVTRPFAARVPRAKVHDKPEGYPRPAITYPGGTFACLA